MFNIIQDKERQHRSNQLLNEFEGGTLGGKTIQQNLNLKRNLSSNSVKFPLQHEIEDGKINGNYDIRYNPNKKEGCQGWTKTLKLLLINCKHIIYLHEVIEGQVFREEC